MMNEKEKQIAESEWKRKYYDGVFTAQAKLMFMEGFKSALSAQSEVEYISNQEELEKAMADYALKFPKVANQIAKEKIEEAITAILNKPEAQRRGYVAEIEADRAEVYAFEVLDYLDQGGE